MLNCCFSTTINQVPAKIVSDMPSVKSPVAFLSTKLLLSKEINTVDPDQTSCMGAV